MADAGLPLLGALLLIAVGSAVIVPVLRPAALARAVTLGAMLAMLWCALRIFADFDGSVGAPTVAFEWTPFAALRFGVDGYNLYLLLLTALLFPVVLLAIWHTPHATSRLHLGLLLALQAGLFGTFAAQNLLLFFVFWEAVLIPMLLLILVYGGPARRRAALTFFMVTMAGSVLLLAAVILLGALHWHQTGTWSFDYDALSALHLAPWVQWFVFGAVALACAIKCPIVPFHAWLPLTYREASTAGTALMAGVLSKMGAYGFLRLAVPFAPDVAPLAAPWMMGLAAVSIVYGAIAALRQSRPGDVVAYSSLSHMGFIVLGIFAFQTTALQGALLQMLSHGVVASGLFLLLGLLEQRADAGGALALRAPRLAVATMLLVLASLALPLTSGFTAEFFILLGAFSEGWAAWQAQAGVLRLAAALLATTAVVLGATYMLRLARTLLYDAPPSGAGARLADLGGREALAIAPLLAVVLALGVWPAPWIAKTAQVTAQLSSFSVAPIAASDTSAATGVIPRRGRSPHGN